MLKKLLIISLLIASKGAVGQFTYQLRSIPNYDMNGNVFIDMIELDCFPNKADSLMFMKLAKSPVAEIWKINTKTKKYTIITKSEMSKD